jgi:hypothetical protein
VSIAATIERGVGGTLAKVGPVARGLIAGTVFGVVYAAWAYYVNAAHGVLAGVQAAVAQGVLNFVRLASIVMLMEWFFRLGRRPATRFVLAVLMPNAIGALFMAGVHAVVGTPEILATISLPTVVGTAMCVPYVLMLLRVPGLSSSAASSSQVSPGAA